MSVESYLKTFKEHNFNNVSILYVSQLTDLTDEVISMQSMLYDDHLSAAVNNSCIIML